MTDRHRECSRKKENAGLRWVVVVFFSVRGSTSAFISCSGPNDPRMRESMDILTLWGHLSLYEGFAEKEMGKRFSSKIINYYYCRCC